jgi:hypothetical protein
VCTCRVEYLEKSMTRVRQFFLHAVIRILGQICTTNIFYFANITGLLGLM